MWVGLLASAGTSDAIIRRFSDELKLLKQNPAALAKMTADGNVPRLDGPEPMKRQMARDHDVWGKVISH